MKQSDLKKYSKAVDNIYNYGCYLIDLLYCALGGEPSFEDILSCYKDFLDKGYIDEECFVLNPGAILKELTGRTFLVEKSTDYSSKAIFVIGYWFNVKTGYHHFVVMRDKNNVKWDSIENSKTVSEGVIESYRNFYLVK